MGQAPPYARVSRIGSPKVALNVTVSLDLPEDKLETDDAVVTTRFVPLGVCAGICPWNCKSTAQPGSNLLLTRFLVPIVLCKFWSASVNHLETYYIVSCWQDDPVSHDGQLHDSQAFVSFASYYTV